MLFGNIIIIYPGSVGSGYHTLGTQDCTVLSAVQSSKDLLDVLCAVGVGCLDTPTGEYFVCVMVMMVVMIPAMLFAMYEKNGQPLEVVIRNIYRVCFQRPKQRPYKTNNFYAVLERQNQLDREVYQIVRKEKADPRRTKTDRSRHRKSEPNG